VNDECKKGFVPVLRSLADLLGQEYTHAVCAAQHYFSGNDLEKVVADAHAQVDFYPDAMQSRLAGLLEAVGAKVIDAPLKHTIVGAGTAKFVAATKTAAAPLSASGYYRMGEDGRLYLTTKSEHYHAPLGHAFPGYGLLDRARALGIPNATHNNTRGFITRHLEQELIRTANGLARDDKDGLAHVLAKEGDLYTLNRVLNLETGSLAVEAALKMILARFYRIQPEVEAPKYQGRTPVVLVMGSDDGGVQANYHGTTVLTQMMRGMWPEAHAALENADVWKVVPIRPNCREDLDAAFAEYEKGAYKIAGFFHEIIMMNYGGRRLTPEFLQYAHALCQQHDVPTVVDEIQSCMWAKHLYLFREYGLTPTCVAIGKGFPGGEYPASRILFSSVMDTMPQFGALVTNGQEELASLAYLVTMEWAQANCEVTAALGLYFEEQFRELASEFPSLITGVDGWRHMSTLCFAGLEQAGSFVKELGQKGLEFSAQTYKAECPPVVLCKIPLIADRKAIDFIIDTMSDALRGLV
jgi:acetylornithine/succinyldiaminopimelate/putrescine aminotransferase